MSYGVEEIIRHVGEEVSIRDLFAAAWRNFRRYFWPALGCGLLACLIAGAVVGMTACIGGALGGAVGVAAGRMSSAGGGMAVRLVAQSLGRLIGAIAGALLVFPLFAGYVWSVVLTYDNRPMEANDLFLGFRTRYKVLGHLGLCQGAIRWVLDTATQLLFMLTLMPVVAGTGLGSPWLMLRLLPIWGMSVVLAWAVSLVFFLTPYFAMTESSATLGSCLRYNCRVLRERPGPFLLVFFFPLLLLMAEAVALAIVIVPAGFLCHAGGGALVAGVLLIVAAGLAAVTVTVGMLLYSVFLSAGFFRMAYGYTLRAPQAQASWPGPAGPAAYSPPAAPYGSSASPPAAATGRQGSGFDPGAFLPPDGRTADEALGNMEGTNPPVDPGESASPGTPPAEPSPREGCPEDGDPPR